jgi:hypothetical protein
MMMHGNSAETLLRVILRVRHSSSNLAITDLSQLRNQFRPIMDTTFGLGEASGTNLSDPGYWLQCFEDSLNPEILLLQFLSKETCACRSSTSPSSRSFLMLPPNCESLQEAFDQWVVEDKRQQGGRKCKGCQTNTREYLQFSAPFTLPVCYVGAVDLNERVRIEGKAYRIAAVTRFLPGHYVSYVLHCDQWYLYDDTKKGGVLQGPLPENFREDAMTGERNLIFLGKEQ